MPPRFLNFFGFERPLLRYLLKMDCKTGWMRFNTVVAIFKRLCALSFFPFWRSNREDFYLPLAQQNENKPEFKMYQPSNQSMVPIFKPFPRIPSYFFINVFWALWQFYSKQTGQNREFKMEIWKVCNILTFVHQLELLLAVMAFSSNSHPSSTGHMARVAASPVTSKLGRKYHYSIIHMNLKCSSVIWNYG